MGVVVRGRVWPLLDSVVVQRAGVDKGSPCSITLSRDRSLDSLTADVSLFYFQVQMAVQVNNGDGPEPIAAERHDNEKQDDIEPAQIERLDSAGGESELSKPATSFDVITHAIHLKDDPSLPAITFRSMLIGTLAAHFPMIPPLTRLQQSACLSLAASYPASTTSSRNP